MDPTAFYGARAEKTQKADFAKKQTNICRLSGDITKNKNSATRRVLREYNTAKMRLWSGLRLQRSPDPMGELQGKPGGPSGWAMAHPKFLLGGPQCIWPYQ